MGAPINRLDHIYQLCSEYKLDIATALSVRDVEANTTSQPSYATKWGTYPLMRFELHKVWERWPKKYHYLFNARFHVAGPKPWQGHSFRADDRATVQMHQRKNSWLEQQEIEQQAFCIAKKLAKMIPEDNLREQATRACYEGASWGIFQIMGFNWTRCGCNNYIELASKMLGEVGQWRCFFEFISSGNQVMINALREKDFLLFAKIYNGRGKPEHYARLLAKAYKRNEQYNHRRTVLHQDRAIENEEEPPEIVHNKKAQATLERMDEALEPPQKVDYRSREKRMGKNAKKKQDYRKKKPNRRKEQRSNRDRKETDSGTVVVRRRRRIVRPND